MLLDGLLLKAVRWRRSRTIWCAAGVLAAGLYAGREQAQVRDDQNTSELRVTLLGLVTPPLVVSAERAQRECIELPKNPLDYEILGPHGDTVISTRCEVVETGRANGTPSAWTVNRYQWTTVFTAEDPSRGQAARDTVVEEEVVLFEAQGRDVRAVWHGRFETGSFAVMRSITPEVARMPDGTTVLSVMSCVNGTGGCDQEFLHRHADGSWFPVKQTWLEQLPGSYAGRIRHGVRIDPASLVGTAGFYGDADANCCPSQELVVNLTLRSDVLALSKQPLVRPVQK